MVAKSPACKRCSKPALPEPLRRLDFNVSLCEACTEGFLEAEWGWLAESWRNRNGVFSNAKAKRAPSPQAGPHPDFN